MFFLRKPNSNAEGASPPARNVLLFLPSLAAELIFIAASWYAMDAFKYLRLSPAGFLVTYATWVATWFFARWGRACLPLRFGIWGAIELGLPAGLLALISPGLTHPLTGGEIAFAALWMSSLCQLWRRWPVPNGVSPIWEITRRLLLIVVAYILLSPFITDLELGGVDAHWYANMLTDFIAQSRAGVFPVFIGQGFHAYNGAIHPFRSAPIFLWTSGIWDLVTFRSLTIYSLQHITALSTGVFAAIAMYLALTGLRWRNRWAAVGFAVLYISSPAILQVLYCSEMYMTWAAIACLPMVMYANGRVLTRSDRLGWVTLGASLALIWMAHPPVALIATITSAFLQLVALSTRRIDRLLTTNIGASAISFVLLSGFYFTSMSEVPPRSEASLVSDGLQLLSIMTVTFVGLRACFRGEWIWLCALVPSAWLLYRTNPIWIAWGAAFLLIVSIVRAINAGPFNVRKKEAPGRASLFAAPLAAAVAWPVAQHYHLGGNVGGLDLLERYSEVWPAFFKPITRELISLSDFQPGLAVFFCLGFSLIVMWIRGPRAAGLFASAASMIALLFLRIPWVSDFFVAFTPINLAGIVSLPLTLRLLPPCIALVCTGGFLTWCSLRPRKKLIGVVAGAVLGAMLIGWSLWEARNILARGRSVVATRALTQRHLLPENMKLERFAYDLLPLPEYFSNGPTDPRLESRLLNSRQQVVFGESELSQAMEAESGAREISLGSKINSADPNWLNLSPALTVLPGENLLLRFKFTAPSNYAGVFIFSSDQGDYREYLLPNAGSSRAFGVDPTHPKLISLWNTSAVPATYRFLVLKGFGNDLNEGDFAHVFVSSFNPSSSKIELKSLIPYRARVRMDETGFIETPRVYLPGYVARVDAELAPIERSQQKLVMIQLKPGTHEVELRYQGSLKLHLAGWCSGLSWVGMLVLLIRRRCF